MVSTQYARALTFNNVYQGPLRELASPDGLMDRSLAHVVMAIDFREGLSQHQP
jgi:hypothetical protein